MDHRYRPAPKECTPGRKAIPPRFPHKRSILTALILSALLPAAARAAVQVWNVGVSGNGPYSVAYNLLSGNDGPAGLAGITGMTVRIVDGSGSTVRSIAVSDPACWTNGAHSGANGVAWDGLDDSGNAVPFGSYTAEVEIAGAAQSALVQVLGPTADAVYKDGQFSFNGDVNLDVRQPLHNTLYWPNMNTSAGPQNQLEGMRVVSPDLTGTMVPASVITGGPDRVATGTGFSTACSMLPDGNLVVGGTSSLQGGKLVVVRGDASPAGSPATNTVGAFGSGLYVRALHAFGTSAAPRVYFIANGRPSNTFDNGQQPVQYIDFGQPSPAPVTLIPASGASGSTRSFAINRAEDTIWLAGSNDGVTTRTFYLKRFTRTGAVPGTWAAATLASYVLPANITGPTVNTWVALSPDETILWVATSANISGQVSVQGVNPTTGALIAGQSITSGIPNWPEQLVQTGTFDGTSYGNGNLVCATMGAGSQTVAKQLFVLAPKDSGSSDLATSVPFSVAPRLIFSQQPGPAMAGSALSVQPSVAVVDTANHPVTSYSGSVTLSLSGGAAGAALGGTATAPFVNGVAAFGNVSVDRRGQGYVLTATGGPGSAVSEPFNITGTPARLDFTTQPGGAKVGYAFLSQPVVAVVDSDGTVITTASGTVSLSIAPGTGAAGATLSGTTSVATSAGVAAFSGLSLNKPGAYTLMASGVGLLASPSASFTVADKTKGPWGDVDADGYVTMADAELVSQYITGTPALSDAQRDRIRRYGDIAGTVNRTDVGNGTVDAQDTRRSALVGSGLIDAGTAGPSAGYGDVDGDGRVTIADTVLVARSQAGLVTDPAILARIQAKGGGDISPTLPYIGWGDGQITEADRALIEQRAAGTEANAPAYTDYWPLHLNTAAHPEVVSDRYTFTDLSGISGDMLNQVTSLTKAAYEVNGYTVTEVVGTDSNVAGVFKGQDGSIYALYIKYPLAFSNRRVDFVSPVKVLDARAAAGQASTWSGNTTGASPEYGVRPVRFKGTIVSRSDDYTNAAGPYKTATPASRWSSTIRVRLGVEILAGPTSSVEMQQAFFFDFAPGIGVIRRGQAGVVSAPAPTLDRPLMELELGTVRGIQYSSTTP